MTVGNSARPPHPYPYLSLGAPRDSNQRPLSCQAGALKLTVFLRFLRMAKVGIDPRTSCLCWIIVSLSWCCILITELRPKIERLLALSVIDD